MQRFDQRLNRLLEECARNAGEDVGTYVARAVAAQMVADLKHTETIPVKELLDHLFEAGMFETDALPDVTGVLSDPDRLRALRATGLLDSPPEEIYDRITRAAAAALDVPFAAMSLVDADRTFCKSTAQVGDVPLRQRQMAFDQSLCQYTVAEGNALVVEDARSDPVLMNHPEVRGGAVVAYLGIPLIDHDGNAIGSLCVCDQKPRLWSSGHVQILSELAHVAAERIFGPAPAV
jgi:hypothetical protein